MRRVLDAMRDELFASADPAARRLAPSLAAVTFDMPFQVSGIGDRNYRGAALVVDAERGLAITDRNTVPVPLGDARLTFAGAVEIPARVVYVHPLHNLVVLQYDPALLRGTEVRSATLDAAPLREGEQVDVVGIDAGGEFRSRATTVAGLDPLQLPLSRSVSFRDSNLVVATLLNGPEDIAGVLADRQGRVRGLWASFAFDNGRETAQQNRAMAAALLGETLELARGAGTLHSLEAEFGLQTLAAARALGLPESWMARLAQHDATGHRVLGVVRLVGGTPAATLLQPGDILLAVDGQPVTRFDEVERAVAGKGEVRVQVWRSDGEHAIDVPTVALDGRNISRVLQWAGATLQEPPREISAQRGIEPSGVYVAYFAYGSPANRYGLLPGRRIVEVDGQPTGDLDAFLRAVAGRPDRASLRLRTLSLAGVPELITLELDRHYWPTFELRRQADGWQRTALE